MREDRRCASPRVTCAIDDRGTGAMIMNSERDLPSVIQIPVAPWPTIPDGAHALEFRLVYDGSLPAARPREKRVSEKHAIRRVFSDQLRALRDLHPRLRYDAAFADTATHDDRGGARLVHPAPATFSRCNRTFIPLITEDHGVGCGLDILFLRRDRPGGLVNAGGDIDNRMKVLFDALRLPSADNEVVGPPGDDPSPFYCLLEDDKLITDIRITTDRLLTPSVRENASASDVLLIVHVTTIVLDPGNLISLTF